MISPVAPGFPCILTLIESTSTTQLGHLSLNDTTCGIHSRFGYFRSLWLVYPPTIEYHHTCIHIWQFFHKTCASMFEFPTFPVGTSVLRYDDLCQGVIFVQYILRTHASCLSPILFYFRCHASGRYCGRFNSVYVPESG